MPGDVYCYLMGHAVYVEVNGCHFINIQRDTARYVSYNYRRTIDTLRRKRAVHLQYE